MSLKQQGTKKTPLELREARELPYERLGFLIYEGKKRIKAYKQINKEIHKQLVKTCKESNYRLWYGDIIDINGKTGIGLLIPDFDTFPDVEEPNKKKPDGLKCSICKKTLKSKSGYTLHMKSKHNMETDQTEE